MENNKVKAFAQRVEESHFAYLCKLYPNCVADNWFMKNQRVNIKPGPKYTKVNIGDSGRFMVVNSTGEIFGIKAYGVIHRGHYYGTLDNPSPAAFQPYP